MTTDNKKFLLNRLSEPVKKRSALPVDVRRYYTDVNGTIVAKATVAANLQTDWPIYMFSEYDASGGFYFGNTNVPSKAGFYLCSFIWGDQNPFFFGFTGLSDIQTKVYQGDIVTIYADNLLVPTTFVWIVQSVNKSSLGSIRRDTANHIHPGNDNIIVEKFQYYTDNQLQWQQPITILNIKDRIGNIASDTFNPYANKSPEQINNSFIELPIGFKLNQYVGIYTYMEFATDVIQFNYIIKTNKSEIEFDLKKQNLLN